MAWHGSLLLVVPLLVVPLLLGAGALALNRVPLLDPPGATERLQTYLTRNRAETRPDHPFPELRTPVVAGSPEAVAARLEQAMRALGWRDLQRDGDRLRATVVTPLLGFRDDLEARVEPADGATRLHLRSASRTGRGDFGANAHHIGALLQRLREPAGEGLARRPK